MTQETPSDIQDVDSAHDGAKKSDILYIYKSTCTDNPEEENTEVVPIQEGLTKTPRARKAKVFGQDVERLYALGCELFMDAGHKIPDTEKRVEDAKTVVRLMMERDGVSREALETGMRYVNEDTGGGTWPGWRAVVQSFAGLRKHWSKIESQMTRPRGPARSGPKRRSIASGEDEFPW